MQIVIDIDGDQVKVSSPDGKNRFNPFETHNMSAEEYHTLQLAFETLRQKYPREWFARRVGRHIEPTNWEIRYILRIAEQIYAV